MASETKFDLIIIGSGPGGYVGAVRAARLGMKVACVEKHSSLGGVCLNVGCIPSKALLDSSEYYHLAREKFSEHGIKTGDVQIDIGTMMKRKKEVVEKLTGGVKSLLERNKVKIVHGTARLTGPNEVTVRKGDGNGDSEQLTADAVLLATGSEPVEIPDLKFDGKRIVSSTEALSFESVPEHLCIVGGGYIGLELGSVWGRLGARVTVIEMLDGIATSLDSQLARRLQRVLTDQGMKILLKTKVTDARISDDSVKVTIEKDNDSDTITCDKLLVAVGRKPLTKGLGLSDLGIETDQDSGHILVDDKYRTNVESIRAIGDLVPGPMLAHKASFEAIAAVECIAGKAGQVNYDAVPSIVYTWPEVASVGLTEQEVKKRDIDHVKSTFPFTGNGRALCMGESEGFVKIIAHKKTDRVLGVHILGPRASDMIAECVLAMEFGASTEDIARTIHAHPTLAETLHEAAMALV